jgi:hypothetical protein
MAMEARRRFIAVDDVEELLLPRQAPQSRRNVVHVISFDVVSAPLI